MKRRIPVIFSVFLALFGILLLLGALEPVVNAWVQNRIGRSPGQGILFVLRLTGGGLIVLALLVVAFVRFVLPEQEQISARLRSALQALDGWFEKRLGRIVNFSAAEKSIEWKSFNRWDVLILALMMVFSILAMLERMQGNYPLVILGSDAANISSMAAAHNNPEFFAKDYFLNDPSNFRIYFQLHVLLVSWLGILLGNYSLAFVFLLGPTVFLTLFSTYWFGRTLMGSRIWALLLVFFNSIPVYLLFENWGLAEDSVPRTLIQALLPFLLGLIWLWRDQPRKWPLIAFLTGLLAYIHAVGTPTIMAVMLLGMFSQMPHDWRFSKKMAVSATLAFIMLIAASVFIANYLGARNHGEFVNYNQMINMYHTYFPPEILNVPAAIQQLFRFYVGSWIFPLGLVGLFWMWLCRRKQRRFAGLLISWLVGIFLVAVMLPFFERTVETYLRILPIETELIRGTRYFVPFLGLAFIGGLSAFSNILKQKWMKALLLLFGFIFLAKYYTYHSTDFLLLEKTRSCFAQGSILCAESTDIQKLMIALQSQTPVGSGVFFAQDARDTLPLAVRYLAQRSLVYSWKDRAVGFSKPAKMVKWDEIYTQLADYSTTYAWFLQSPAEFLDFTKNLGADYVVLNANPDQLYVPDLPVTIVYQNHSYSLLRIINSE